MILVIGYGNTLMGDDGFGIYLTQKLQQKTANSNRNIKFILAYQLTLELSYDIKDFTKVIFIDASYGTPSFSIACPVINNSDSTLSHHLNPQVLIKTTKELFNVNIEFEIYSVLVDNFKMQESLSLEMSEPLNKIVNYLENYLKSINS